MSALQILHFTRTHEGDIYFNDVGLRINSAVKFDLIESGRVIGTLFTSSNRAIAQLPDGREFIRRTRPWMPSYYSCQLMGADDEIAAAFEMKRPLLKARTNEVRFLDGRRFYAKEVGKREIPERDAQFCYVFEEEGDIKCRITTFLKRPFVFYAPSTIELEGNVSFESGIGAWEILCFMQLMQLCMYDADN